MSKRQFDQKPNVKKPRPIDYVKEYRECQLPNGFGSFLGARNHPVARPLEIANYALLSHIRECVPGFPSSNYDLRAEALQKYVAEVRVSKPCAERWGYLSDVVIVMCTPINTLFDTWFRSPSGRLSVATWQMSLSTQSMTSSNGDWSLSICCISVPTPLSPDSYRQTLPFAIQFPKNVWISCSEPTNCIHDDKQTLGAILLTRLKLGPRLASLIFHTAKQGVEARHKNRPLLGQ